MEKSISVQTEENQMQDPRESILLMAKAVQDQISGYRAESIEKEKVLLDLGAEALSKALTTDEQVTELRQQIRLLALEQLRNRALIQLNLQYARVGAAASLMRIELNQFPDLIAEIPPLYGFLTSANLEIYAADEAETFREIVNSSWDKLSKYFARVEKAYDSL